MSIATVVSISGQAWARDADGNMRELRVGDTLAEGESLVTSDNGRVELDFADNLEPAVIEGGQVVVMTPDLDANQPVDAGEFSALDEDLEALLAALDDDDIDLLDVLDPTAAGAGPGGGADGGHSFVQLARIAENIDPLAFEFGMGEFDGPPEIEGGDLLLAEAEEADVDVVIPDPTVSITAFEIGSSNNEVGSILTGTATNASTVTVTLTGPNGTITFEVEVDAEGNWSVDLSGQNLPEGSYTVEAIASNQQGTRSEPATAESGYTLPTVEITTFEIGSEGNDVSTALTGTAGNATHVNVTLTGPNGLVETFEVAVVNGAWSVDLSGLDLPAGEYSVEATARDAQNNTSAPAEADSGYTLPSILGLSDSDITVNEQYLEGGTAAGEGEPSASGQFTLVSPGGVGAIFVVGTLSEGGALQDGDKVKLSQADLEGLSLDNPVVIETPQGNTLILTGYDATTGEVSYTFELGSAVEHEAGEGRNELAKDGIQIELMDGLGNTANGTVDVTIIDDIPESFANVQAIEVPISEVIVGNWAAGWVNVKTTNGQYNGEDLDSDDFKDFISWGARAGGSQGSNYVFEDNEDLRDLDTGKVDQTFVLGKFTHNNFPIFFNEGTLESVDLTMEFTILIDGVETQVTHTINIKHEETPNNTGTPEGDADIVTIYNAATIVRIEVGDREFEFEILGFKRVGEPDSDPVTQVITFENASNTFELIGRISSTDDLPVLTGQIEDPFWGADGPDDEEPVLWSTDSGEQAVAEGGTLTIEGQYGTLIVSADGRYIYEVSRETRDNMNIGEDKKDVFTYYLQDADGDRVQSTLTINLAGVANPVDPDSIGEPEVQVALEGPADLVLKVDNSNAQAKPEGFEVSAYYYHQPGAASQSGRWEKGEISKAEGRGFGVDRAGPDGSGAAKSEIANGQRLEVRFDQDVSEASFQLAWLSDSEYAKYTLHYDDGTSSSTIVKGDTPEGGFDGIGAVITVSPPDGKKISGIDFDTPAIGETGYGVGNDYVVHQISYKAAELYAIVVDVTLADDNVSEEVVSVVLAGVPAGATLSAGEDNGDGSWTLPLDGSGDYKVELTNGKLTISGLTLQVPLDHQGPVEVDAMVTVQGGDSLAIIGGLYDETLVGGEGDDLLVGGAGNDILTGGLGDDVFKWNFGDQGTSENAAFDIVTDFGEGDNTLHIADLLQEESQGSINDFILAKEEGDDLVLYIKHDGAESAIDSDGSNADQIIKLEGKSFGSWQDGEGQVFGNGEDLIQHLIETGQIHIDQ